MTTEQERLATLEAQKADLERRVDRLEANQRWGVLTIMGLLFKTLMDVIGVQL